MQRQILYLNGQQKDLLENVDDTPENVVNKTVAESAGDEGGYHVISGQHLDAHPRDKVINVVASQGVLITQNILD